MATIDGASLLDHADLLDQLLAATTDHIDVYDRDGRYLYASPAGAAALGVAATDLVGKTWHELNVSAALIAHQDRQRAFVFQTGNPVRGDMSFPAVQGIRHYEYVLSPLRGTDGTIVAVVSTRHDVTALKLVDHDLQAIEETAQLGCWDYSVATQQVWWSEGTYRIHGLLPGQPILTGEASLQYIHPDDHNKYRQEILAKVAGGESFTTDLRIMPTADTLRFIEVRGKPIFDSHNTLIGFRGIVQDITTRKQVELALRESEARFAAIFESSPDAILITRLSDGQILNVNAQFAQLSGYSRADAIGQTTLGLQLWADLAERTTVTTYLQTERTIQNYEATFRCKSGETFVGLFSCRRLAIDGQDCALSVVRDIRARKQAEDALRQREQLLDLFFSQSLAGCFFMMLDQPIEWNASVDQDAVLDYVFDHERVTRVNDALLAQYGATREQFLGTTLTDFFAHDLVHGRAVLRQAFNQGQLQIETDERKVDGTPMIIEGDYVCLYDNDGRITGHFGIQRDITERKQMERTLRESQAKLQAVLDSTLAGVMKLRFYADTTFAYDYISPHCATILGYTCDELIANPDIWSSQVHPDDWQNVLAPVIERMLALTESDSYTLEYRFRRKDGSLCWILAKGWVVWCAPANHWDITAVVMDISDRKQAEAKLQANEARFRELSEASPANIYIIVRRVDGSYYFEHISRVIETIHEIPVERFLENATIIVNCMHPDDRPGYEAKVQHSLETLEPFCHEWRIITPSGIIKWLQGTSCPKQRDGGEVAWYGAVIEITERKQAEAKLQERETLLRLFAQCAPASIAMLDRAMRYIVASQRWADDFQLGPFEALIGRSHYDVFPEIPAHWRQIHQQCLAGEVVVCDEELFVRADGTQQWLAWEVRPWHTATNEIGGIIIFAEDITQRKQVERSLQTLNQALEQKVAERTAALRSREAQIRQQANREAMLREITQRIRQSLDLTTIFATACTEVRQWCQADRVGIFQFFPDSEWDDGTFVAEAVTPGFPSVLAIPVHDHCFGDQYAALYQQGRVQATADIDQAGLQDCHRAVLAQFHIRANLIVPLLQDNQLWGLLCIHQCTAPRQWQPFEIQVAQEITYQLAIAIQQANLFEQLQQELEERQLAEESLVEINQELLRATRLKDEFLANMSHELRTPLNAILGMSEGLQEHIFGTVNPRQLKALQTIEGAGLHLLSLINDILDLAKVESGQIELMHTPTAVATLCQSSLEFIKQQSLKKQIQVDLKLPAPLPDLLLDERRVRQVLVNLLSNAVKFTPTGGKITLEISRTSRPASAEVTRHWLRFAVRDTGIGIAPEHIAKLFQPFVQIDSALNRQYEGTGLGLALVKRIVELHGGQVGLTSEVGVGSCFTIDLPYVLAPSATPVLPPPNVLNTEQRQPDPSSIPLILLVEDNEDNIVTVAGYLEVQGYRLLLARNGQEAIDWLQTQCPDMILMDIQMPGMDGLEAIRRIRHDLSLGQVPIIALTALAMEGDRDRCLAAGANDYLSKPVKLKQLAATISRFLEPPQTD